MAGDWFRDDGHSMDDGHGHWWTDELTEDQVERLLDIVKSGKNRHWAWLATWLTGEMHGAIEPGLMRVNGMAPTAENVLRFYEEDERWSDDPGTYEAFA